MPNDYQPPEKGEILKNKNVKKRKKQKKGGKLYHRKGNEKKERQECNIIYHNRLITRAFSSYKLQHLKFEEITLKVKTNKKQLHRSSSYLKVESLGSLSLR